MTQPKSDLAYLRSEKAKAEQQLRYYKHREKILEHQIPELTRKARVHRLCTRAGMLESFLIAPEELTNDQVMELLKIAFRQPEVALALAKMILLMLLYSIGHSALVMVAGTSVGFVQRISGNTRYNKAETVLKVIMGTAILLIGFYMFWLAF